MASKDEYYQKIIASLQSDISLNKSEITKLKSEVARQQKEIEILKVSQNSPQKSLGTHQLKIDLEALRLEVKRVCDKAILANYEHLPTIFADRQEFDNFRKAAKKEFISADTFTDYKRSLEVQLKSIEKKLGQCFCLLAINVYNQK